MAATASMKLLLGHRRHAQRLLGQAKLALFGVSQPLNVLSRPAAQLVQETAAFRKFGGFRHFCSADEAGSSESSLMKSMASKIKDQLSAESVIIKDVSGDGRHVCIYVVSSAFEGQSAMNRQRMVYKAMWEELQTTIHAVDYMVTRTPSEAGLDK